MGGRFQLKPPSGKSRIRSTNGNVSDHIKLLNTELNPICHLLELSGVHPILHISRIRFNSPPQMLRVFVINFLFTDDQFQISKNGSPLCFGISKLDSYRPELFDWYISPVEASG
jgi:hypothetical protein